MRRKHHFFFFATILLALGLILVPLWLRLFWLAQPMVFVSVALIGGAVNWAVNQLPRPEP